jgi:hypothetical protein
MTDYKGLCLTVKMIAISCTREPCEGGARPEPTRAQRIPRVGSQEKGGSPTE